MTCRWSIACRHCSNYIPILDLTPGFNGLGKDNCNTRWELFKFWDLVCLILEILRYLFQHMEAWTKWLPLWTWHFNWKISLNENVYILIRFLIKFVPKGPIVFTSPLVQVIAWHQISDKPLPESVAAKIGSLGLNELKQKHLGFCLNYLNNSIWWQASLIKTYLSPSFNTLRLRQNGHHLQTTFPK